MASEDDLIRVDRRDLGIPGQMASFVGFFDDMEVAWASFQLGERGPFATGVEVAEQYQRRGIATKIYENAKAYFGTEIVPSTELTPDSVAFWKSRGVPIPTNATVLTISEWEERRAATRRNDSQS